MTIYFYGLSEIYKVILFYLFHDLILHVFVSSFSTFFFFSSVKDLLWMQNTDVTYVSRGLQLAAALANWINMY